MCKFCKKVRDENEHLIWDECGMSIVKLSDLKI